MSVPAPHFLLYTEAAALSAASESAISNTLTRPPSADILSQRETDSGGRWRFVLTQPGGETSLEAADEEPESTPQRLELLAVVRGLEALSQPSRVTLLTGSRYLRRGLDFGLSQWRESDWQWERYGRMAPVKNGDLWQRLDRLLNIHALECRPMRLEKVDDLAQPPRFARPSGVPTYKASGRVLRIDAGHGAAKSKVRGVSSKVRPTESVGQRDGNLQIPNLFRAWNWMLRILRINRTTTIKRSRLAHRLRSTNKES